MRSFLEFVEEKKKDSEAIGAKINLGDDNEFPPFVISDDPNSQFYGKNSELAPIVRAFKRGGNWGWSKDDKSGEDKPVKISSRKLYLTGGSLRDHLVGKKPRNIELTTNASSDEIHQILKQNKFKFTGDNDGPGNMTFWITEKNSKGRPFKFNVRVKNDIFELSVFTKSPKGAEEELEVGNHLEDIAGRDFTINAMLLSLTNDNGPNKDLQDYYGGLRHLKTKTIQPIGNIEDKFKEDPIRMLRYARMLCRYGDPETIGEDEVSKVKNLSGCLLTQDRNRIVDEFMRLFNYNDGNMKKFVKLYSNLGLLDKVFPNMMLDSDIPTEMEEIGDKTMTLAWIMRNHPPQEIELNMQGFNPDLIKKILFLINSLKMSENINQEELHDTYSKFITSGVSTNTLKKISEKLNNKTLENFLEFIKLPRIKYYVSNDSNEIHSDFQDLIDPFTNKLNFNKAEQRKKYLEYQNFKSIK